MDVFVRTICYDQKYLYSDDDLFVCEFLVPEIVFSFISCVSGGLISVDEISGKIVNSVNPFPNDKF